MMTDATNRSVRMTQNLECLDRKGVRRSPSVSLVRLSGKPPRPITQNLRLSHVVIDVGTGRPSSLALLGVGHVEDF